jgi:cell wall-associated NlpC family hydrolase
MPGQGNNHRMKTNPSGRKPAEMAHAGIRPIRLGARGPLSRLASARSLIATMALFLAGSLLLFPTLGLNEQPGQSAKAGESRAVQSDQDAYGAVYDQADYLDSLILNRSYDPDAEVAAPEVTPGVTLPPDSLPVTSPSPFPKVYDASGVPQEYLAVEDFLDLEATCYVQVRQANVRAMPNTRSAILDTLTLGDKVAVTGLGLDWSKIQMAGGATGYVLSSLLTTDVVLKPTPTPKPVSRPRVTPSPVGSSLTAAQKQAIIDLARSLIGVRYVYGHESPSEGFDCSGFTSYIYKTLFNITLSRSAKDQSRNGVAVSSADIEIGDIICFDWDSPYGVCDHVGLYIGNGQYIHAAHSRGEVVQSTVNFSRNPIVSIRRIIY